MPNDEYGTRTCKQKGCLAVNFTWEPTVPNPRMCPRCKSYRWEKPGKKQAGAPSPN